MGGVRSRCCLHRHCPLVHHGFAGLAARLPQFLEEVESRELRYSLEAHPVLGRFHSRDHVYRVCGLCLRFGDMIGEASCCPSRYPRSRMNQSRSFGFRGEIARG